MKINTKHLTYGVVGTLALGITSAAMARPQGTGGTLIRFVAGQVARAADVNDNFTLVLEAAQAADARAASARDTADNAKSTADAASASASEALTQANSVEGLASAANGAAASALTKADEALTKANSVEGLANAASSTASAANSTAQAANAKADEALTKANSVEGLANSANTAAQDAKDDATDALAQVGTLSTDVTPLLALATASGIRLGVNEDTPIARTHIVQNDIGTTNAHTSNDVLVVEGVDAVLGLISDKSGDFGSVIAMREVNTGGVFNSQWALARETGEEGALTFFHGFEPNITNNREIFSLEYEEQDPALPYPAQGNARLHGGTLDLVNYPDISGPDNPNLMLGCLPDSNYFQFEASAALGFEGGINPNDGPLSNAGFAYFPYDGAPNRGFLRLTFGSQRNPAEHASAGFIFGEDGSAFKPGGGSSWDVPSDRRLKQNIVDLEGSLETLLSLRGVHFEYRDPEAIGQRSGQRTGFIAQEVEAVLPDWVSESADGMKRLSIRGFEALSVEAMRELAQKNAELDDALAERGRALAKCQEELSALRERVSTLEAVAAQVSALSAAVDLLKESN